MLEQLRDDMYEISTDLCEIINNIKERSSSINHKEEIEGIVLIMKQAQLLFEAMAGIEIDDETKKKKYTNDKQRQLRASELLKDDTNYQTAKKRLREIEAENMNNSIELNYLRNRMSVLKRILSAKTEELRTENIKLSLSNHKTTVEVCHVTR